MALRLECVKLADEQLPLRLAYTRYLDLVHRTLSFEHGTLYVTEWTSGRLLPVAVCGERREPGPPAPVAPRPRAPPRGGAGSPAGGVPPPRVRRDPSPACRPPAPAL